MAHELTIDELRKAAANLGRIEDFFATRSGWRLEQAGFNAVKRARQAVTSMRETVEPFLLYQGISTEVEANPVPDQLAAETFDNGKLDRFSAFLAQLDRWFLGHAGYNVKPGAEEQLEPIYRSLVGIGRALEPIMENNHFESAERPAPAEPPPPPTTPSEAPTGEAEPAAAEASEADVQPTEAAPAGPIAAPSMVTDGDRLVLQDTDEKPLLQTFKGEVELTYDCKEMLSNFLAQHEVSFSGYHLRKFEAEVQRRIEGTPEGNLLVLKVGGFGGQQKPFFSYVSKFKPPEPADEDE